MTDVLLAGAIIVTDPVLILTVTPEGPEIVVISVCAETIVDNVFPKLSVAGRSRPLVPIDAEEAELALAGTEVVPGELPVDGAIAALLIRAGDALPVGAGDALPGPTEEVTASTPADESTDVADEPPATADDRLDSAEESTEAAVGSRNSLPNDVGAGSPFVPA
jgi:hypothetical protein